LGPSKLPRDPAQAAAHHRQHREHAPGEEDDPELLDGVDRRVAVGEVLVMLAGVPVVDRAQREDVDQAVHHVLVHRPLGEVAGDRDRHDEQPLPGGLLHPAHAPGDRRDAGRIHHADMQQTVVPGADPGDVLVAEPALPLGHHGKSPLRSLRSLIY
jgi:hypothetical protein